MANISSFKRFCLTKRKAIRLLYDELNHAELRDSDSQKINQEKKELTEHEMNLIEVNVLNLESSTEKRRLAIPNGQFE